MAKEWAQERAADDGSPMIDNLSIFQLPVGVRPSEELKDCLDSFMTKKHGLVPETNNDVKISTLKTSPWSAVTNAGVEAAMEITSSLLKGKSANSNKSKHGVLSVRAASMLVMMTAIF